MNTLKRWKKKELRDWVSDLDDSKKTLYGITINIIMFSLIEVIIGLFFVNKYISFIVGTILGAIVAITLTRNMYSVIEKAIVADEATAESMVRKGAILRMLFLFVIFVIAVLLNKYINVYAMAISTFSLKFAAYLWPFTNKYISTRYVTKGR